jgi:hypothetical protein
MAECGRPGRCNVLTAARSGQSDDVLLGHVAAPGDGRTPAGLNVAQASGHDAQGMGDISMPIPRADFQGDGG